MVASEFKILSERFVKPSISTPSALRCYSLSLSDQFAPRQYIPLAFFYPTGSTTETPQILEKALSNTLSYYYPFAGRLKNNLFIECNDMGVLFTEARIKGSMSEFLRKPKSQVLAYHRSLLFSDDGEASLVLVQLSYFDCGGMAVSICMSHKLGDASTLSNFIRDWAAMVHQPTHIPSPQFPGTSLFPPFHDPSLIQEFPVSRTEIPVRKFLFCASKIAQLKDMAAKSGVENPTRVEVVSALLYRSAMVSSKAISGSFRPAGFVLPMNIRPFTVPRLAKGSVGNLADCFAISTIKEDSDMTLPELVSQIRNAKVNLQKEYKTKAKANGSSPPVEVVNENLTRSNSLDLYFCTSWCRSGFSDVDLGWGKPSSVSVLYDAGPKDTFVLMDATNEDAIEAVVMLEEPQMSAFETNKELLAFASLSA